MIEIVWEFFVKEDSRGQFEFAYGPGGAWSKLFGRSSGFRGTTLLRDIKNPLHYLTVDLWESEKHREQALADYADEYSELDKAFDEWTESEIEVGIFRIIAEATVHPPAKTERS